MDAARAQTVSRPSHAHFCPLHVAEDLPQPCGMPWLPRCLRAAGPAFSAGTARGASPRMRRRRRCTRRRRPRKSRAGNRPLKELPGRAVLLSGETPACWQHSRHPRGWHSRSWAAWILGTGWVPAWNARGYGRSLVFHLPLWPAGRCPACEVPGRGVDAATGLILDRVPL